VRTDDAAGSTTVVLPLKVRGLMPSLPISAIIAATVFTDTEMPAACRSAVMRGEP